MKAIFILFVLLPVIYSIERVVRENEHVHSISCAPNEEILIKRVTLSLSTDGTTQHFHRSNAISDALSRVSQGSCSYESLIEFGKLCHRKNICDFVASRRHVKRECQFSSII